MGLCKCPKKKVTNLFCFEHTVNVCEHCLVADHSRCVVQSYLHWLQDSDYDPTCRLCGKNLNDANSDSCVRLLCHDVFHWSCLDSYQRSLPLTTAPAGYVCPICSKPIFPPQNIVGPVADTLRGLLSTVNWARAGLGMPLIDDVSESVHVKPHESHALSNGTANSVPPLGSALPSKQLPHQTSVAFHPNVPQSVITVDGGGSLAYSRGGDRVELLSGSSSSLSNDPDIDKYKRRPALQWLLRSISSSFGGAGPRSGHRSNPFSRYLILLVIVVIGFVTVVIMFDRLGRWTTEGDPQFDPLANPNIRVQKE